MRLPLLLLALAATATARADIAFSFDFDSVPAGSNASVFDTSALSFHNATTAFLQDGDGIDIPGTEHWIVDTATDAWSPVTIGNTVDWGFDTAPSGTNALNAFNGPVFLKFDQPYTLTNFSVTLDNSTLGDLGTSSIWFVSTTGTLGQLDFDATVPGVTVASSSGLAGVSGVVLQGGGFYDNLTVSVSAIPEPSTYALWGGLGCLGFVAWRRFGRRRAP
ncbi:MAG TPA: hypothetical protein VK178_05700 [Opitutaceae bacterium]|nr:hypothetical protein [Opitutaceae bacterium]